MSMNPLERKKLVANWLTLQQIRKRSSDRQDLSWVVAKIWDLCDDAPNEAFEFILGVLEEDASSAGMAILSAGPLEALLRKHGPRIIGRVERRARRDPKFVQLLGHVWKNTMSSTIWMRVESARNRANDLAARQAERSR
ncbi:MAG: DUF6869 domain-containing protein [Rhodanobacteraceae bacterium]